MATGEKPAGSELIDLLVELLAGEQHATRKILAQHVEERGKCRVCTSGAFRVHPPYPCLLRCAALRAVRRSTPRPEGPA